MSAATGRVRRDGLPAMLLFVAVPFGSLLLGMAAHPAGIIDSEEEIRERTAHWRPLAARAAEEAGVPVDLLLALVATESSGRPRATSPSGAVGLAQLLPSTAYGTAALLGVPDPGALDLYDPAVNLRLGAAYLGEQMRSFGNDAALALAAYHRGPGDPAAWRRAAPGRSGIDLLRSHAPPKTRAYVLLVLARRRWFQEPKPAAPVPPLGTPGAPPPSAIGLSTGTRGF